MVRNPAAGGRKQLFESTLGALKRFGVKVDVGQTGAAGEEEELIREAARDKTYDAVVAAGGDGTIRKMVAGILGTSLPLGIIPLGTINVLALEIGLEPDPERVARSIAFGPAERIQVGLINGRPFVLMVGAGLDGRVVAGVSPALKKIFGKGAYVLAGIRNLMCRSPAELTATVDGKDYQASWVIVSNGTYYAGKYLLAPGTHLANPGFTVSLFQAVRRLGSAAELVALISRGAWGRPALQLYGTRKIVLRSMGVEPVQADGDSVGRLPVTIRPASHPLPIILPEDYPRRGTVPR
ncbi:MAG: diacylglycerol/lipid kinase family protein [Nitrospinaceae bacterium]